MHDNGYIKDLYCDSTETSFYGYFSEHRDEITKKFPCAHKIMIAYGKKIEDRKCRIIYTDITSTNILSSREVLPEEKKFNAYYPKPLSKVELSSTGKYVYTPYNTNNTPRFVVSNFGSNQARFKVFYRCPMSFCPVKDWGLIVEREMGPLEKLEFKCAMGLPIEDMISHLQG